MTENTEYGSRPYKPILCVDFDGVIHSYTSGWQGLSTINDPPVPGAIAFLREAVKHFRVAIYSTRSSDGAGIRAMREYIGYHVADQRLSDDEELAWASAIEWPTQKPSAFVTLDDRALTFTGTFPTMETLRTFKPWNKQT